MSVQLSRRTLALALTMLAGVVPLQAQSSQVFQFGTPDLSCIAENSACSVDPAFDPSFGGYRAGGRVDWGFTFSPLAAPITSIWLDVMVVGLFPSYPGNINPQAGQTGNYLEVNGVPFAPFLNNSDGRDLRSFDLTALLTAGPATFAVVAYQPDGYGGNYEGWAGVDYATLTVNYETTAAPEPGSLLLVGTGMAGVAATLARRRRRR